jgi:hypothetical protein
MSLAFIVYIFRKERESILNASARSVLKYGYYMAPIVIYGLLVFPFIKNMSVLDHFKIIVRPYLPIGFILFYLLLVLRVAFMDC